MSEPAQSPVAGAGSSGDSLDSGDSFADGVQSEGAADELAAVSIESRRRRQSVDYGGSGGSVVTDSVRMYLREIGRVPLLVAAEEVALAQRIQRAVQAEVRLADVAAADQSDGHGGVPVDPVLDPAHPPIGEAEMRRLIRDKRDGDAARHELTQANLRLVVSIAKRYVGRGLSLLDLIQEGNLGLMRAVDKFDHEKGFKFSTYATWWIRQAITRAIADQARTIRIPVHMVESINRVRRLQRQLTQEFEREPTISELAERCELPEARIEEILRISQDPLSLDSPVGGEDDSFLGDFIEDEKAAVPADAAARHMLVDAVVEILDELSPREQEVVRLRFGIDDGRPRTLEEVGRQFGVTRERVRQIEAKTLAKLRHPQRSERLRGFLDSL